jgi:hypothetical protein
MTQLIIEGIALPEAPEGKYKSYPKSTSVTLDMISGRTVSEVGYRKTYIEYTSNILSNDLKNSILAVLRGDADIDVTHMPDGGTEMQRELFKCESITPPSSSFIVNGEQYWRGLSFVLKGVSPIA